MKKFLPASLLVSILLAPMGLFARLPLENLAQSSLHFIENKGQVVDQNNNSRPDIQFKLSTPGMNVFIGNGQIHYQWAKPVNNEPTSSFNLHPSSPNPDHSPSLTPQSWNMYRMDVTLVGANKNAKVITEDKSDYYERYYLSQFGEAGATAYSYQKITYQNVYPNIDWVLYIKDNKVEYDFVVKLGGKVTDIKLKYDGASSLKVNADGNLTATTPMGSVTEQTPKSFQEDGTTITSHFVLKNGELSFKTESYSGVLTIDPTLAWATYFGGGSGFWITAPGGLVCDQNDEVYMGGSTPITTNIATSGAYQITFGGGTYDAFLGKFNSSGLPKWVTYYGGTGKELSNSLAIDGFGNIFMVGVTNNGSSIATTNSYQSTYGGGISDLFLVKFDSSGSRDWATYYGGSGTDNMVNGQNSSSFITCNSQGDIYICGETNSSSGISTSNSHQSVFGGGSYDGFLVKFDSSGSRDWATYYGGSDFDRAHGVACDNNGNLFMVGYTSSDSAIATPGSFQDSLVMVGNGFLVKFDSNGVRQWGTYYGLTIPSYVICNNDGDIYMTGGVDFAGTYTYSGINITSDNGYDTVYNGPTGGNSNGGGDVFIAKFNSNGERQWGTYYGGPAGDVGLALVWHNNEIYLYGATGSDSGIATINGYQPNFGGGESDNFLVVFKDSNNVLSRKWATYFGGSGDETPADGSIVYNNMGYVYMSGATSSVAGIATSGSFQDTFAGLGTAYLAKFCFAAIASEISINGKDSICSNSSETYSLPAVEDAESYLWTLPPGWSGSSDSSSIIVTSDTSGGMISVRIVRCGDTSNAQTKEVYVRPSIPPVITTDDFILGTQAPYSSYQWCLNGNPIPNATQAKYTVTANGDYTVITTNEYGCTDTSGVYTVSNYTGINNIADLAQSITVYPNPAQDKVFIQSPVAVNIRISSIEGKLLLYQEKAKEVDINNLSAGTYLLRVTNQNGVPLKTIKLTKLK